MVWIGSCYTRLAPIVVATGVTLTTVATACERETISTLLSPDDSWIVIVQQVTCSNEAFGMTGVTDNVQIIRRGDEPKTGNDFFVVDHGSPKDRPLTRWLSSQKLQITVPNKSLIGRQRISFEGVDVVIKFEPDDPAERERWLKSLGLPTK